MLIELINYIIYFVNTIIRLLPISLYSGTFISYLLFNDFRGELLFLGFMVNELLSFAYKKGLHGLDKRECAIISDTDNYFVLPSSITQTVGFLFGFITMDTYYTNTFTSIKFLSLIVLLFLTLFSRIQVGCETIATALIFGLFGCFIGCIYYYIIKDYYKPSLDSEENIDDYINL
jgi:hypothetical protein